MSKLRFSGSLLAVAFVATVFAWPATNAEASLVFQATGTASSTYGSQTIGGKAEFSVSGTTLTLVLTNIGDVTLFKANTLTGVLFNVTGTASLTNVDGSTAYVDTFDAYDKKKNPSGTDSNKNVGTNVDLAPATSGSGTWSDNVTGTLPAGYNFGIGTVGMSIFNGNLVGSADYAIYVNGTGGANGIGTNLGNDGLKTDGPYVRNSATFTWTVNSGFSTSQITKARFTFGTNPEATLDDDNGDEDTPPEVPEPATLAVWASFGLFGLAARRLRSK